jgi:DNA-binding MarR family transcriptional regulator
MTKNEVMINDLLVETFNKILTIEGEALKNVCKKYNVSNKEIHVIEKVVKYNNSSMSIVAEALKITRGSFTIAIKTLERKGYVKRIKSEIDSRSYNIQITKIGLEIHKQHMKFHDSMIKAIIKGTDAVEQNILVDSLKRLITFFEEIEVSKWLK